MKKNEIISSINQSYNALFTWLEIHGEAFWDIGPEGKWNTGQQIKHLYQSAKPLNKALKIPKFILAYKFGKSNRPSRSKDQIIERYLERLKTTQNILSPFSQNMSIPETKVRNNLIKKLKSMQHVQVKSLETKWNEKALDIYIVPHPLMGKMTMREINIWSAYHVEHHYNSIRTNCSPF